MPKYRLFVRYPTVMNLVGYQAIWFGSILAGNGFLFLACVLVLLHFLSCTDRRREAIILISCTAVGFLCDGLWAIAGLYVFEPTPAILPAPLWLAMIWLGFAATLRHGLSFAIAKPALGVALAAVGAPLSYLAAGRLGAVSFPLGSALSAVIISGTWIVLMSLFILLVHYVDRTSEATVIPR